MVEELVLGPAAAAFLEVGAFVAFALAGFELLRWRLGDRLPAWLEAHRHRGPLAGAALGAFPGCGGAIVVMPLYLRGQVSFGTVVAALTATMGDSSFVLLAVDPALAVVFHLGLMVVGAATGVLVDRLGIAPHGAPAATTTGGDEVAGPGVTALVTGPSTVGAAAAPTGLTGRPTIRDVPWGLLGFWSLTAAALVVAVPTVLQLVEPERLDLAGIPTATVLGLAGAVVCLGLTVADRGGGHLEHVRPPSGLGPRAVLVDAARETARVTTWVVVAFVGYEVLVATTGLDVGALPSIGLLGVAAGALLGLIPGCGPQLVLTGLYAQGALPLSVLAANALSQDGDALIPLLASDRRSAVVASIVTVVPGLLIGWLLLALGL
jgi:hypothetical protein